MSNAALDMPFLLLPFRPASDPSAARTFIRNFFSMEKGADLKGARLEQELILTEPMVSSTTGSPTGHTAQTFQVLSSVMKWCWSRLAGGVVSWEAYELFRVGEQGMSTGPQVGLTANMYRFRHGSRRFCYLHTS